MATTDASLLPATELAAALRRREVSASEILEATLERADRLTDSLNPFAHRLDDRARAAAAESDRRLAAGDARPLEGVPATVKDTLWLAGVPCEDGSRTRADLVPDETSASIERLEAAGAVVFAKTTNPEFCYMGITDSSLRGCTRNPWDFGRTPGGSSGGAGACVAAGLGPVALGTDGGGSIRIPAAFCGVVGMKPTFGLVPHVPDVSAWPTLSVIGPLARTVADARLALEVLAGFDPRDRASLPDGTLRPATGRPARDLVLVATPDLGGAAPVDDDVRRVFEETLDALRAAGARVILDDPGLPGSGRLWTTVAAVDSRVAQAEAYEGARDLLDPATAAFIETGESFGLLEYAAAQRRREAIAAAHAAVLERHRADALLTPTLGCQAFGHGATHPPTIGGVDTGPPWEDWTGFLADANLAGLPACSVPGGLGDDGLPVGVQIVGRRTEDGRVLDVAAVVEAAAGFGARLAPVLDG